MNQAEHSGVQKWVTDLNNLYKKESALYEIDFKPEGFRWIDCNDIEHSAISVVRADGTSANSIIVVLNFTPVPLFNYRIGSPFPGEWIEILNSDAAEYGGQGYGNQGKVIAEHIPLHGQPFSLNITLPPLGVLFLKRNEALKSVQQKDKETQD